MNRSLILHLVRFLIACAVCSETVAQTTTNTTVPTPKYKIDGDFIDWKTYRTGWTETGLDWSKITVTPKFDEFDLKQFFYDNDGTYLYLFFKCIPTVKDRYEKTHSSGALGYIYIDSDMNTNTGAGTRTSSGESVVQGADIQIWLPVGMYSSYSAGKSETGCSVEYEMKRWDAASKEFSRDVREESSRSDLPLIAHGKDGIEIALLLTDLRQSKGSKFTLACWEMASPRDAINKTTIEIK